MIGKIIGAIAGSKMAKRSSNVSEPMGAFAGLVTASALRRFSLPVIIALAAGGYAVKKLMDRKQGFHAATSYPRTSKAKTVPA